MNAYYDTGALVPLYVSETFSESIAAYVESRMEALPVSLFHRLELENALRLKIFREEIEEAQCLAIFRKVESNIRDGMLVLRPTSWIDALDKARSIGERTSAKVGCRTLDLIHVAIAAQWGCSVFVTADDRQIQAARLEGFSTVDVRDLHRRRGDDRGESGVIREPRMRYGSRKRRRRD
jgi:predicted nucleic acid-binding protein